MAAGEILKTLIIIIKTVFSLFLQYAHQRDYTFKSSLFCVVGVWILVFISEMFQIGVHIEWYLINDYIIDRILYHVKNQEILASMHFHRFRLKTNLVSRVTFFTKS